MKKGTHVSAISEDRNLGFRNLIQSALRFKVFFADPVFGQQFVQLADTDTRGRGAGIDSAPVERQELIQIVSFKIFDTPASCLG